MERRLGRVVSILGIILIVVIVAIGTLQVPELVNKAVEHGLSTTVKNVMPSVVHVQFEGNKIGYDGRKVSWQGSGVIVSKNGIILTARHVCKEPGLFTVTLSDGREFKTTQACINRNYDVGYLKIEDPNNNFPAAKFGDSDKVKLGSRVLAVGSPWGKEHFNSVTLGIISALSRAGGEECKSWGWEILFQTDVASNPGNSGGPVFSTNGEIVGIVVGMYGPGSYAGITYCIPSNICSNFVSTAQLAFLMNHVSIVKTNERLDELGNQVKKFADDMWDLERKCGDNIRDFERRLDDVESKFDELVEVDPNNEEKVKDVIL